MLRISTAIAAGAGALCLGLQGQLEMWVAVLAMLAVVPAALAPLRWPGERGRVSRRLLANAAVLVATLGGATYLVMARARTGMADSSELAQHVGISLAVPLVCLLIAQLWSADSLREYRVVLIGTLLGGLLALATAEEASAQNLLSPLGFVLAVGWTSGLTALCLLQRTKQQKAAAFVHSGRALGGGGLQLGALVLASVVLGLAALDVLPHPDGWHPPGFDGSATGPGDRAGGDLQASARSSHTYFSGVLDLNSRGDLSDTPLASVPGDSPNLWAASVLFNYSGRHWTNSRWTRKNQNIPLDGGGSYDLRPGAVSGGPPAQADRSDIVRLLDRKSMLPVIAPGQAVAVRINGGVLPAGRSAWLTSGYPRPTTYDVRSDAEITSTRTDEDTDLPATLPTRVRDLAGRITRNAATTEEKVAAIELYLRTNYRYRLDSPLPGEGEDAVDDFLFDSREGFCEHFASAAAVLLRAVGVPTRVVTGFVNGKDEGSRRIFRGIDAHAWIQVHVGDGRWIFSDPTAGVALAPDDRGVLERALSLVGEHWRSVAGLLFAVLVAVAGAFFLLRTFRSARQRRSERAASASDQALAAFTRLELALARARRARPPDRSIRELATDLVADWPGGLPDPASAQAALLLVERVLYDAAPVPEAAARVAVAELDRLTGLARA